MIPNEYLYYYYFNSEALEAMRGGRIRSAFLAEQQAAFYAGDGSSTQALRDWRRTHADRESSYMQEAWTGREEDMAGIVEKRRAGDYGRPAPHLFDGPYRRGPPVLIPQLPDPARLPFP